MQAFLALQCHYSILYGHFQTNSVSDLQGDGLTQTADPFGRRLMARAFSHVAIFRGSMITFLYVPPIVRCHLRFEPFANIVVEMGRVSSSINNVIELCRERITIH